MQEAAKAGLTMKNIKTNTYNYFEISVNSNYGFYVILI